MASERRLLFGEVAERYDASRPSYPAALVDDVLELAASGPGIRALEVGAGTGKATVLFAARGVQVSALEPSAAMAAIARRNCATYPNVTIEESDFEHWDARTSPFALLFSAQAWHWVDPEVRYVRARERLSRGGLLAAFWNRPDWTSSSVHAGLREAYERTVPDFGVRPGPMHPATEGPVELWGDWTREIDAASGFEQPEVRFYPWTREYGSQQYAELLTTHSDHILLPPERRAALLAEVVRVIDRAGGTLTLGYETQLCLARRR